MDTKTKGNRCGGINFLAVLKKIILPQGGRNKEEERRHCKGLIFFSLVNINVLN